MKRILLALAVAVSVLLTGCNFDSAECIRQVALVNKSTFDATAKKAEAMLLALKGEDQFAKGMAMAWFVSQDRQMQAMGFGECNRDTALEWAKVLVNPLVNVWGISENAKTTRHASDNSVETQRIIFGTVGDVATQAIQKEPVIVGPSEGMGVLYPEASVGN